MNLCTPEGWSWHGLASMVAADAGKDVYCEKPCSHNMFESRQIVEAARKYNRIVQHGTNSRSGVAIREAMEHIRTGLIGDVYDEFNFGRANPSAIRSFLTYAYTTWNQLPAHLAINLWREYVRKFKFSELFTSEKVGGIQVIEDMINKRMRQFDVVELDDTGTPTGGLITSLEAQHLFERGIQVEEVKIHGVYIDPSFEERIIKTWETNWVNTFTRAE